MRVFLKTRLAANATLAAAPVAGRIYGRSTAPRTSSDTVVHPIVLFYPLSNRVLNTAGTPFEGGMVALFAVVGITEGASDVVADAIQSAIQAALHRQSGTAGSIFVHPIRREMDVDVEDYDELSQRVYTRRGGIYRVQAHPT